jgi:transposase
LPASAVIVTEHRARAWTCPGCGHLNRAAIPAESRAQVIGPRLAALRSYVRSRPHLGPRGVQEFVETVFEVPVSLDTVAALEQQTSTALAATLEEAKDAGRAAPVKNADETGWRQAGRRPWLWMAATVADFVIHVRRGFEGLQTLLGEAIRGLVCRDRGSA